ncbi:MAG: divalent-cation tolerance protein CutA [Methanobacteriaceae archaeon]|jgi:periplasmic divalent cation tolerance protein|nr:divalent-cation tolerance protein CutA [Candidatus Methanorudis spinitermitis]
MMAIIYITTSNEEEAIKIGTHIVKERLAACSNIIKDMKSIYWWEDNLENDDEAILILKTIEEKVDEIIAKVKEIHSYDNPCIIALPVIKASNSYLNWLKDEII